MAVTDVTRAFVASYNPTVTGLPARTCPVSIPELTGVCVAVAVGDPVGVEVGVDVLVPPGVGEVGVAVWVGVEEVGVIVPVGVEDVGVAVPVGVEVVGVIVPLGVGVAVPAGAEEVGVGVGDSPAVGVEVGVGVSPTTVRLVPVEGRLVSILSPFDTRAVHSIALWPACNPLALNVNAAPLVVALLPLLPAIATMKLPPCGPLIATAASAPKRLVTVILLASNRLALYVQVNSALVYPSAATLLRLTVAVALDPTLTLAGLTLVDTDVWV